MYKILVGIAKELSNIKQIMAEEGKTVLDENQVKSLKITWDLYFTDQAVMNNDAESLGVFDGDDYKTLMEMDEFKSQVKDYQKVQAILRNAFLASTIEK